MRIWLAVLLAATAARAEVRVKEYTIPCGHGIHDVWAVGEPGGPVWFSAQRSGELGILDPKTGAVPLVPLGRGSAPHGVIAGPDGAAGSYIARIDSTTGATKVLDPPTPRQGALRFDLRTEKFETFRSPSRAANVRQIHGRRGEVWTPESAADKLVVYRYK